MFYAFVGLTALVIIAGVVLRYQDNRLNNLLEMKRLQLVLMDEENTRLATKMKRLKDAVRYGGPWDGNYKGPYEYLTRLITDD